MKKFKLQVFTVNQDEYKRTIEAENMDELTEAISEVKWLQFPEEEGTTFIQKKYIIEIYISEVKEDVK